jgi:hypothetical protein
MIDFTVRGTDAGLSLCRENALTNDRKKERITFWGPRALVVVSCALTLLAAQPAIASSRSGAAKPVLLKEAGQAGAAQLFEVRALRGTDKKVAATRVPESFLASARRLHVLATVEIFQRLLMAELRTGERQVLPGLYFEPVCVEVLAPASMTRVCGVSSFSPPLPQVAQAFAIAHCLLAPPIA